MKTLILNLYLLLIITKISVKTFDIRSMPLYNFRRVVPIRNVLMHPSMFKQQCYFNNVLIECPISSVDFPNNIMDYDRSSQILKQEQQLENLSRAIKKTDEDVINIQSPNETPSSRRMLNQMPASNLNMLSLHGNPGGDVLPDNTVLPTLRPTSNKLNMKLDSPYTKQLKSISQFTASTEEIPLPIISSHELEVTTALTELPSSTIKNSLRIMTSGEKFAKSLDRFERKFYATTFNKLRSLSPSSRRENGMSYVQSGLFLHLALMALSAEVDPDTSREIDECLDLHVPDKERIQLIEETVSSLPLSTDDLKFRWSSRLVLQNQSVSVQFRANIAPALRLQVDSFNDTHTPKEMATALNHMIERDSGGAIHNTFEEDDLSEGVSAILITTLYFRARWRSSPTLLNGSLPFHDFDGAPARTVRMIRINDVMRYADLGDWDAEAFEIYYSTPGLSLLVLVPRGNSLRRLTEQTVNTSIKDITEKMQPLRIAVTLPLYTLRMTLLLPNKLEAMKMSRLVDSNNTQTKSFWLSHAVQRIMFWAEAGRNAFKDDGLEWEETPQRSLVVDRPYIFYVRGKNKTLMNGNFVL